VGFLISVPDFHRRETTERFNIFEVLPTKQAEKSVFILEVRPDEEIFCFTKERAKDLKGVSSQ
jgi:hypothetical protein